MKYAATCPNCQKKISIIRILSALTPFTFKCGKCNTRLYVKGITKKILAIILSMGLSAVFFLQYIFGSGKHENYNYFLVPVLIIIAMEIILALLICNKARLEVKRNKVN